MFGERFDLAILSGPLALLGLTSGRWFWWFGYAIVGVYRLRVILFALPRRVCPIAAIASRAFCSGQPELSGGALLWHRGIAQSLKRRLEFSLPPARGRLRANDGRPVRMIPSRW